MTAYSFGNRWVGIVSMRSSPTLIPEPLHRMASRLRAESTARPISIGAGATLTLGQALQLLPEIRKRYLLAGNVAMASECQHIEQAFRSGQWPTVRPWLQRDLFTAHTRRSRRALVRPASSRAQGRSASAPRPSASTNSAVERHIGPRVEPRTHLPAESGVETGWGDSFPLAPQSPWLPELPPATIETLASAGVELDEALSLWLRWARLHKSYLYEEVRDDDFGVGALGLLKWLGQRWLRLAILEQARTQVVDFASSAQVSAFLADDANARKAIADWLRSSGTMMFGRGETVMIENGRGLRSVEDVALQVVGALSLASATPEPALKLLDAAGYRPREDDPDWHQMVQRTAGMEPQVGSTHEGPDHARVFTVTVTANGRTSTAEASSAKAARRLALKQWVLEHAPHMVPPSRPAPITSEPRLYANPSPGHRSAVTALGATFDAAAPALFAQALTHRSWLHENKAAAAIAKQRDYSVLATEGSEVLTTFVHHQYAVTTLSRTTSLDAEGVIAPAVSEEAVARLFEVLGLSDGAVLRSRGTPLTREMKSDLVQAVVAAAWRSNRWELARSQPPALSQWIRSFVPRLDPITMVQEYGALHGVHFVYDYTTRGADHQRQFRAALHLANDHRSLEGEWKTNKGDAKHSVSRLLLNLLSAETTGDLSKDESDMLRSCLLAEFRAVSPEAPDVHRDVLVGRMGLDKLAVGDYHGYLKWSTARSRVLGDESPAVVERAGNYYAAALRELRRASIRRAVLSSLPWRRQDEDEQSGLKEWSASSAPATLALLEGILSAVTSGEPVAAAVIKFVAEEVTALAVSSGQRLETTVDAASPDRSFTIRLLNTNLGEALGPLVATVEAANCGASWVREADSAILTIAGIPLTHDPIAGAAFEAYATSYDDTWLTQLLQAVADLLRVTESSQHDGLGPEAVPAVNGVLTACRSGG